MMRMTRRQLAVAPAFLQSLRANEKLIVAAVGVGGVASSYLAGVDSENIVALCDVDDTYAAKMFAKYPRAKRYRDFRKMLDAEKSLDLVIVATPDHSHAVITKAALERRKAVYCAKPLTRTVHEARTLARLAREAKVATQMSVQTCGAEPAAALEDYVHSGVIGQVHQAHVWTNRPVWPQGGVRPAGAPTSPADLDWDLWLGPAPARAFHPAYHPFVWRGWRDFGTGALGDMACHAFHIVAKALHLGDPTLIHASNAYSVGLGAEPGSPLAWAKSHYIDTSEMFPHASHITWDFASVRLHWYDGGLKPARPRALPVDQAWPSSGLLFEGSSGALFTGFTGEKPLLLRRGVEPLDPPSGRARRSPGHYGELPAAIRGGAAPMCEFGFGARITEWALLGNLAVRAGQPLAWDAAAGRITNYQKANDWLNEPARAGWEV